MKIKRDDTVMVMTGRNRGKTGKVMRVIPEANRVVVEGVNIVKRHTKARPGVLQAGIIEKEAPIDISNVMVVCPKCDRPTRVGHHFIEEAGRLRKVRHCTRPNCGQDLAEPSRAWAKGASS